MWQLELVKQATREEEATQRKRSENLLRDPLDVNLHKFRLKIHKTRQGIIKGPGPFSQGTLSQELKFSLQGHPRAY